MTHPSAESDRECPFLQPGRPSGMEGAFYCRLPDGRVRVPSLADRHCFCLPGRWRECPTYRRHAASS